MQVKMFFTIKLTKLSEKDIICFKNNGIGAFYSGNEKCGACMYNWYEFEYVNFKNAASDI